ncbi:pre-RNA processing PIH1/Nop17-domain-containing protein [Mycena belliarum]|uniref:Pre-RNA processing PIH1/Nop17-domain-containing protein n=1 Tax=Mycena belliarum TaxID=1033014 RepID=A0AAD6XEE6_9AGAR|nr:pre-RNA processing PIH1/Nop17-domain-containing protein [Mycena belliae]
MATNVPIQLNPSPGFCLKSATVQPATLKIPPAARPGPNSLEPQATSIQIPKGLKIFVNVAWDKSVPPPPEGNEQAIQRAMCAEDDLDHFNPDAWFVPVVVSDARQDTDKAGKPSLVFDCIFHSSIRSRSVRDAVFKTFIQELALQRIEAQTSLILSRQISSPNIASKGKLHPRTVLIPASFFSSSGPAPPKKPLIEEVVPAGVISTSGGKTDAPAKGILKPTAASSVTRPTVPPSPGVTSRPTWNWTKAEQGALEITIAVPLLTRALVAQTTLELEERRFILTLPNKQSLDVNFGVSDAEIVVLSHQAPETQFSASESQGPGHAALMLKRERPLDVDNATAEWRVAEGVLVVTA